MTGVATSNSDSQSTAATSASQATTLVNEDDDNDDDDASTEISTDSLDFTDFYTPKNYHDHSSDTVPSTVPSADRYAKRVDYYPVNVSPNKSSVHGQRAATSSTRTPPRHAVKERYLLIKGRKILLPVSNTNPMHFSVFTALLKYPELTLEVAKNLNVEDLVSLYAISKDFHMLVNSRFTAMITAQWYCKANESGRTFTHRCYKNLCMRDPARRINENLPSQLRFIPSFRWLRMVLFREAVVDDIVISLAQEGHRLPKGTSLVIKKIWFTIDISDNARRVGLLHNTKFWSNRDLFLATTFFLKLDMRLTHPATGNGELGLRKMLLGQRSLSVLGKVLRREEMRNQLEMLTMIVRYNYEAPRHRNMSILGIPPDEVGQLQYEGWGRRKTKFIGIDELVMKEALRRRLQLQSWYVDMMIYGYINKKTWEDIRTPMPAPCDMVESDDEDSDDDNG